MEISTKISSIDFQSLTNPNKVEVHLNDQTNEVNKILVSYQFLTGKKALLKDGQSEGEFSGCSKDNLLSFLWISQHTVDRC